MYNFREYYLFSSPIIKKLFKVDTHFAVVTTVLFTVLFICRLACLWTQVMDSKPPTAFHENVTTNARFD